MLQGILKHPILLGIAVLALIGVSLLWAQEGPPPEPPVIVIDPGAGAPPPPPGQPGPSGQPGSGLTTAPSAPPPPRGTPGVLGQAEVRYPPSTRPTSNQVKFKFENPTVDSVLNYLADVAGYIVVKESPVSGRINAVSPQPLTPQETIEFLNTALKTADMTAIQQGRTLIITTFDKAKHDSIPVRYVSEPELVPDTDEVVTYVIPLSHVDATKLKQDLTPLIGTDADVAANASSNMLIITDRSARVRRVVQMTHFLDAKDPTISDLKMVQLKYADATSAAKLINTVFAPPDDQTTNGGNAGGGGGRNGGGGGGGRSGGGGGGGGGPGAFFRQMMGQNNQSADKGGPNNRVNAVADDRTNTVVVTGPTEGVTMAYSLLTKLDSNPSAEQTFFIYALKNGSSDKLAVVLNTLFGNSTGTGSTGATSTQRQSTSAFGSTSGSSGFGGSSGGLGGSGGSSGSLGLGGTSGGGTGIGARAGTTSTGTNRTATGSQTGNRGATSELTGQVFVVSNPDTNSLLVTTASKYADQVKQIIHELDRAVPQVLIKVLIAEVTHDRSDDLGADFSVLNVRPSGNGTTLTQQLGNAAAFTANGGLSVAVVEKNVTATLHALSQQDKLDVLSRPYILTSDNQEATITIGNEVPFITNTRETDTGQTINTIQYQDIGIILDVTPHINQDGLVIMDVTPEISEQTGNGVSIAQGVTAPIFSKRSASSRVGIADGQTIVIGGLMQDQKTTTITKVPLLGDLPYVGPAFTRYQNTVTKTELLIFLTPHVALQPATLKPMSADELRGTKLTPNAVAPGEFQDHMRGMQRGESGLEPSTRPDVFVPTSQPTSMPNVLSLPFSIPAREPGNGSIEPAEPGGQQPIYVPVPVPVPTGGSGG